MIGACKGTSLNEDQYDVIVAQQKNNRKIEVWCKESCWSDLFDIFQVNRVLQQDFIFFQISLPR